MLQSNPGHSYAQSSIKLLTDAAATPEAVRAEISRAVEMATQEDTILFSFAGHGFQNREDGRYYLTPHGFDMARSAETALAWRDIAALLHKAKSRVIVILDACQAGLSGTEDSAPTIRPLWRCWPAITRRCSCSRHPRAARPAPRTRMGRRHLHLALIEALQSKRSTYDLDHDGAIEISELYQGLRRILARETGGNQTPWLVRQDLLGDFVVF